MCHVNRAWRIRGIAARLRWMPRGLTLDGMSVAIKTTSVTESRGSRDAGTAMTAASGR